MKYIKFSSDCQVLPKNEYDHTDRDNPVLTKSADFVCNYLCQSSYESPCQILAVVTDDSAFDLWYAAADQQVKDQVTVLSELNAGAYISQWIQVCGPANPELSNLDIVSSFIAGL